MTSMDQRAVCMTCSDVERLTSVGRESAGKRIASLLVATWDKLLLWQYRAQERHNLARLDERMMKDMGISAADIERELSKPFWKN